MRTSIYLTERQRERIDELARRLGTNSMNQTLVQAVSIALAVTQEEDTMAELHDIRISFTHDSLFDGCDAAELAGVDQAASMDEYERLVTQEIETVYPGSLVTVYQRRGNWVEVDGDTDHPEAEAVRQIMDDIFGVMDWPVTTDPYPPAPTE